MDRWGTYPDWVAALSTFLALAGAAVAVYYTHQTTKREEARDNRYELAHRRSQAELFAVWEDAKESDDGDVVVGFSYRNASQLPLFDVNVYEWTHHLMPDQVDPQYRRERWRELGTVAPGEHNFFFMHSEREVQEDQEDSEVGRSYTVIFRDAADRTWHRDHNGVLHEEAPFWEGLRQYDGSH